MAFILLFVDVVSLVSPDVSGILHGQQATAAVNIASHGTGVGGFAHGNV